MHSTCVSLVPVMDETQGFVCARPVLCPLTGRHADSMQGLSLASCPWLIEQPSKSLVLGGKTTASCQATTHQCAACCQRRQQRPSLSFSGQPGPQNKFYGSQGCPARL